MLTRIPKWQGNNLVEAHEAEEERRRRADRTLECGCVDCCSCDEDSDDPEYWREK